MRTTLREAAPYLLAASAVFLFVSFGLAASDAKEAAFATAGLMLVVAACAGPFLTDGVDIQRGALRGGLFAACAGLACVLAGRSLEALLCGLFCGLYAYTLGLLADMFPARVQRVVVAMAGLAVLATLHFWDEFHLFGAENRKASADLAFHLNPAAAVSVTLDYDWIHAPELYRNNQTAESMFGLKLGGVAAYGWKLLLIVAILLPVRWRLSKSGRRR